MKLHILVILFLLFWLNQGCVSLNQQEENKDPPPRITAKMSLDSLVDAGVKHGGDTLKAVKKSINHRNAWVKAELYLFDQIQKNQDSWPPNFLINAINLYQASGTKNGHQLFKILVHSDRPLSKQLAWHLGASLPSPKMAAEIDNKLTEALSDNEVDDLFIPKMAEALSNNGLKSSYTLLRQGLQVSQNISFARAMMALNPEQAPNDFLDYLARAPLEELRQLNMTSVDPLTCLEILEFMQAHEVNISHPHFEHLYFFSISRNNALQDAARKVLESYFPQHGQHLALLLSKLPNWVQIAFIDGSRRKMSAVVGVFLDELKRVSAQQEVIEEINSAIR